MSGIERLRAAQDERALAYLDGEGLAFHPPFMPSPYIVNAASDEHRFPRAADSSVSTVGSDGQRYFNADVDVVINMPTTVLTLAESAWVFGGRHVRVIGGHIVTTINSSGVFVISTNVGSVFVEGMLIDCNGMDSDGFAIRWNQTIATELSFGRTDQAPVVIQHCRVERMQGALAGIHADAVQTQDLLEQLSIENFTFEGDYQGIQLTAKPRLGTFLRRINGRWWTSGTRGHITSYWLADADTDTHQVHLMGDDCWASDVDISSWGTEAVQPAQDKAWGPSLQSDALSSYLNFADGDVPIFGRIRKGQPSSGDFATASSTGLNYRSPWPGAAAPVAGA